MTQAWELSAHEVLTAFRDKTLSPSELVAALHHRISTIDKSGDKPINAITELLDDAMTAAKAADDYYVAGDFDPLGTGAHALAGLPVVTKEKHFLAGRTVSEGLQARADTISALTHPLVERIQQAGGVVLGRTTSPEFSCATVTHSPLWGITRNPWDRRYSPGGSSGGAGAALAAGYAPLATASDIAGSTRIPAGYSGVVGYKAPYGAVPGAGPMATDWYRGDGPMARTVADVALLYSVMAGLDPRDHTTVPRAETLTPPGPDAAEWFQGKRIGLSTNLGGYEVDKYAVRAIDQTRRLLESAGADVVEIDLGWSSERIRDVTMGHFGHLLAGSMVEALEQYDWQAADYTRQFVKDSQRAAQQLTLWETISAEHQIQHELAAQLADVEVLIAPVSAVCALDAEASYLDGLSFENAQGQTVQLDHYWQAHMTVPFNINNRCPVLALPAPETGSPIPVGLQIIGKAYDENTVFHAGYAFEQLSPFPGLALQASAVSTQSLGQAV